MKTILFIGQAPARPSSAHEVSGTYLHTWLHYIGFSDHDIQQYCHFYALIDTFPGSSKSGHIPPTKAQISSYRPTLMRLVRRIQPDIIVPVGKLAISELTGMRNTPLTNIIGQTFVLDPFRVLGHTIPCIPLSHPSGASVWNHAHKEHVQKALAALHQAAR
ncbi:MAG TPA: uracil-DNA glycosylase family protein [Candidatus Saccharimonadales bacterium]|nr:uracil-DNA glycosylase family protein [Candidatus Saccharimonadales bacterium]